ncbi:tRNA preQ1(34) S-adenosylmethionine ribosyltransferase-isomerase QueA [Corallococcus sp. AB011P]|uniref:tRNA preQ1(34) S-adenosylmethionine ribosyltransferase-isomerase QueA n=1 Tax=unclassified Corallococcus TaxID=2685029 RepID=UPI000EA2D431|nr:MULTISPECIES: tRNA preQ1(34) S-adenosylmethionine ribosyltransferase-isomerase QueA [unclassified Corallococcus]RKG57446.1 tRNA preQ1(34) S-adenosylmethionine ribosyltransferase-isomerase QueA [Corallococcus sp. AB011P]RKH83540.1 tRNA preQ1(34) S-adenosylmethionine ribosyltransferase-isomerase QueA [Corallococcus sp. AB045]
MSSLLSDYDFELPEAQIAQAPLPNRDASRLMVVSRATGAWSHQHFTGLADLLREGDLLVLNDARVIPARLLGQKSGTGGRVELLVVRPAATATLTSAALGGAPESLEWVCLGQASKGLKPGQSVTFAGGLSAEVLEALGGGEYRVRFHAAPGASLASLLDAAGRLPLPPYITREPEAADAERYQTVYARASGAVAAPTAGLHFTEDVFAKLAAKGVQRAEVTLDVGPGTFLPVREEVLDKHHMHPERFTVPEATAAAVNAAKAEGRRVVAVGTTVVRTLESATDPDTGRLRSGPGETAMFIRPGYVFRQVDVLLTNFHLPRSTLVMLVSALLGRERTLAAYQEAVRAGYRFFSYGDAMLVKE